MRKSKEMPVCVNMAPGVRGDPMAAGRGTPPRGLRAKAGGTPGGAAAPGSGRA